MNILVIIGIIFLSIFVVALILSRDFRHWISETLTAIGLLIADAIPAVGGWLRDALDLVRRAISIYAFILLCTAVVTLVLMAIALFIPWPTGSAFLFVLAICLIILAWLPAGIILRVFKVTDAVVPSALRALIAWVAFVGWLCLMTPDVITMKSLLGVALVGFIFFGSAFKTKAIDKLMIPLVVIMCLWVAWSYFWPESFRSTTRYTESWAKKIQTKKDRGSINNETDAATTYGQALQDITVLYKLNNNNVLNDVMTDTVKMGTIVKIVSHKQEIRVIDGQGFIQIQLANVKGSFVRGEKYFVEAEYIQLASPRDVTPKNDDLLRKKVVKDEHISSNLNYVGGKFLVGEHTLALKNGQESDWCSIQECHAYTFLSGNSCRFILTYEDGTTAESWGSTAWPGKYKFKVKNLSAETPVLKVI